MKGYSIMQRLAMKVFAQYGVTNMIINSRICELFGIKMWRMTTALVKAKRSGGRGVKKLAGKGEINRLGNSRFITLI